MSLLKWEFAIIELIADERIDWWGNWEEEEIMYRYKEEKPINWLCYRLVDIRGRKKEKDTVYTAANLYYAIIMIIM